MSRQPLNYHYTIETTRPLFPRHLAEMLLAQRFMQQHLVGVKDEQNNEHSYGSTYIILDEAQREVPHERMSYREMCEHYHTWDRQDIGDVERDALYWMWSLLLRENWDQNMGMLYTYLGEFIDELLKVREHCGNIGAFATEEEAVQAH